MRISCHFLSTLLKTGLTDLSTSARYNPAFGRDDNGASFNHNWYYGFFGVILLCIVDMDAEEHG